VNCDYSIWVDANLTLLQSPANAVEILGDHEFGACKHWLANWYEGALAVLHRDCPERIGTQIEKYDSLGFSRECELFAGNFLVRKHTNRVKMFNHIWWYELATLSKRDQISMAYAAWRAELPICNLGDFYDQVFFNVIDHNYIER
jgi:hypothetical protein